MPYWLSVLTLKAAGFAGFLLLAFPISYLVFQSAFEVKPLLSWPRRLVAFVAACYIAPVLAELLFGLVTPHGYEGFRATLIPAFLASAATILAALLIAKPQGSKRTSEDARAPREPPPLPAATKTLREARPLSMATASVGMPRVPREPSSPNAAGNEELSPDYATRVRQLREQLRTASLSTQTASARELIDEQVDSKWSDWRARERGKILEATQTWWVEETSARQPLFFVCLRNETERPVSDFVFEVGDAPSGEVTWSRRRYQITPHRPLELGASYVVKVWLPIPADHPLRRGRVNADIIAAE